MCLLSNRGWKYIRQDIRPHQRRVNAGQVFCLCLHFLLIFISCHCSVLKQNPERKNRLDQTKCKVKFFFLPTSTSEFLGGITPPSPPPSPTNYLWNFLFLITRVYFCIYHQTSNVFPGRLPGKVGGVGRTFLATIFSSEPTHQSRHICGLSPTGYLPRQRL